MRLSFLPGGLLLVQKDGSFVITIDDEVVFDTRLEKAALKKFHTIRREMEEKYPAAELTAEQKQEALKRLIGDQALRQVRNSTRKSKFANPSGPGRFDNR